MITDEEHPAMKAAADVLKQRLGAAIGGRPLDRHALQEAVGIIAQHRWQAIRGGIDFPEMVIMPLPRHNELLLVRRDLDAANINQTIINITVAFKDVTADEIARAVRFAFPSHVPSINMKAKH